MHAPYQHPDALRFLKCVKLQYRPDAVVCLGDEVDHHALSYHESDPDLPSASDELSCAIRFLREVFKLFPKVDVLESNHGSLVYRKAKTAGIPRHLIVPYRQQINAPKGWNWHFDFTLRLPNGSQVYFHHGKSSGQGKLSQRQSMSAIQGHFHSRFHVTYWANPTGLYFDAHAGCLVDHKSLAMAYGRNTLEKGIVGVLMIIDSFPRLIPMPLNKQGRWNGEMP
jgi:hypothetical protein